MTWYFNELDREAEKLREKREDDFGEKMKSLIGKEVTDVLGNSLHGFVIVFDDDTCITATDSEFGDNAFEFVDKKYIGVVV